MELHELFFFKPLPPPLKVDKANEHRGATAESSDAQLSSERRLWLSPTRTQSPVRASLWRIA
jgi:hypothetical protein